MAPRLVPLTAGPYPLVSSAVCCCPAAALPPQQGPVGKVAGGKTPFDAAAASALVELPEYRSDALQVCLCVWGGGRGERRSRGPPVVGGGDRGVGHGLEAHRPFRGLSAGWVGEGGRLGEEGDGVCVALRCSEQGRLGVGVGQMMLA